MEHKKELDELHKKSLDKIDEYLSTKKKLSEEHQEKLKEAKNKWQDSWLELKQFLMYLETLEI
jgi:hypothetical protein